MPRDTEDRTDGDANPTGNKHHLKRRSVLLALGAGSGVALTSQYGRGSTRQGTETDDGEGNDGDLAGEECPPCVDRFSGYFQPAETKAEEEYHPEGIDPVQTVDLRVTDADVVFQEDDGGGTETPATETETATQTPTPTGTTTGTATPTPGPGGEGQAFPDFYFDPVGVRLQPGDTVEFLGREELHTVTAFHTRWGLQQRVPDDVPGFTSPPFLPDDSWYYRFEAPGVYDVLCFPHLGLGMVWRAVVVADDEDVPEEYEDPGEEEPGVPPIPLKVLNAPELDPQNVVDEGTVAWTDLTNVASEPPSGPLE